jgi:hypothetical protein
MNQNTARTARGALLAGGAGALLVGALFLPWYTASVSVHRTSASISVDAWHALSAGRWILLMLGLGTAGLGAVLAIPTLPRHERRAIALAMTAYGAAALALVLFRLISIPGGRIPAGMHVDRSTGLFIALIAAFGILAAGHCSRSGC